MRAIDSPLGVGTARQQQLAELEPQELLEQYVVGVARPNHASLKRERYAQDRVAEAAKIAARSRARAPQEDPPLCACGCGEPVKACHNGVWSQFRAGHWTRGRAAS